jgi:hypothetical protein
MALLKSISFKEIVQNPDHVIKKANSFSEFNILHLGGEQRLLTFGEYSRKSYNRINRRKVIYYFYKNCLKNK